jgi:hypothetical protein
MKKFSGLILSVLLLISSAQAQQAEVTLQLNEQFFDALLDALFKNMSPPEFPLSTNSPKSQVPGSKSQVPGPKSQVPDSGSVLVSGFTEIRNPKSEIRNCADSIKLQREVDGTRTAVRFRDGRVVAPIAFTGNYNPPLIGCIEFAGIAQTAIELEFDANRQALIGRARVLDVNLSGTGGVGSNLLARMVQGSIDKKINPIQILSMDKISFIVPIQNAGSLRMKATGIRHEIANGVLNVRISYEFQKVE